MTSLDQWRQWLRFRVWAPWRINRFESFHLSHSQFGEDMVARMILRDTPRGTYVDLGAHHPVFFSNTYHFYERGWSGLNIDAIPGSMGLFKTLRPRDVSVEACIGAETGKTVRFHMFDKAAYNTIDDERAQQLMSAGTVRRIALHELKTVTVNELLHRHLPGRNIDLFNIDVEGLDEVILRSLDWDTFRPRVIIAEEHSPDIAGTAQSEMAVFLRERGYDSVARCGLSFIAAQRSRRLV